MAKKPTTKTRAKAPKQQAALREGKLRNRPAQPKSRAKKRMDGCTLHFLLTDAYLAAANNGRPLTRSGLEALCLITRSPKADEAKPVRAGDPAAMPAQLETIRQRWVEAFAQNPERIARDATREAELAASLREATFFELMQNANDAAAALLSRRASRRMGQAGKGFRVVLNLTDKPRLHSGAVGLVFDAERARMAISTKLGAKTPSDVPTIRLPFAFDAASEHPALRALIDVYDTVIVMPFRDKQARAFCEARWNRLVDDISLLSALPALNAMIWERNDATEHHTRTIRKGEDNKISSRDEGRKTGPIQLVLRRPGGGEAGGPDTSESASPQARPAARQHGKIDMKRASGRKTNGAARTAKPGGRKAASRRQAPETAKSKNIRIAKALIKAASELPLAKRPTPQTPAPEKTSAKKPAAKRSAAKAKPKATAKKTTAKKTPAKKTPARKLTTKKATAKKTATGNPAAKKPAAKKAAPKTSAPKKPASKSAAAKRPAVRKSPPAKPVAKKSANKTAKPARKPTAGKRPSARKAAPKAKSRPAPKKK